MANEKEEGLSGPIIDSALQQKDVPAMSDSLLCPEHPGEEPEVGFGLAGGGYGPYYFCPVCCKILGKDQEDE